MAVVLIFVILGTIAFAAIVACSCARSCAGAGGSTSTSRVAAAGMTAIAVTPPPTKRRRIDFVSLGLGVWTVLVFVFLFLPIVFVVAHSFNKGQALLVWDGFSTKPYHELFNNEPLKQAIRNSFKVAVGSTLIAVVLGGFAGVALARRGGKWAIGFMAIVFLILVTPEIVDAIGLLIWFVRLGGPFATGSRSSTPAGATLGRPLDLQLGGGDAHRAGPTAGPRREPRGGGRRPRRHAARAFRQITLPLMAPALLAGALLSFTFSLDNTIVSTFVASRAPRPSRLRVRLGAVGDPARHRGRGDADAAAHAVRAGRCGVRAPWGGESASDVAATLTGN